jgi:hypothetical protein
LVAVAVAVAGPRPAERTPWAAPARNWCPDANAPLQAAPVPLRAALAEAEMTAGRAE